jgi:8-oxo-dGTP diphosphatase
MTIDAAGTVPWRRRDGALEVALVHRPKYDDWSWAKGKLEAGEPWPVAAARETREETGLQVCLGLPLPPTTYRVLDKRGVPATKRVRYWAATVSGGTGALENEIDAVLWLDSLSAHERLDYAHDREQLRFLTRADASDLLVTWPLVLLGVDGGSTAALAGPHTAALFAAYGVQQVLDANRPEAVAKTLRRVLKSATPVAVCLPVRQARVALEILQQRVATDTEAAQRSEPELPDVADLRLGSGEVLVAHCVGRGRAARVVAVERPYL